MRPVLSLKTSVLLTAPAGSRISFYSFGESYAAELLAAVEESLTAEEAAPRYSNWLREFVDVRLLGGGSHVNEVTGGLGNYGLHSTLGP